MPIYFPISALTPIRPITRRLSIDPGHTDETGEAYPDGWACPP